MNHYKMSMDFLRKVGMKEEGCFQTFCGANTRDATFEGDDYHHVPPCGDGQCEAVVVNCPTCLAIYKAISVDESALVGDNRTQPPIAPVVADTKESLLAEYERTKGPAWAEYKRVTDPVWAEYKRVRGLALAEYLRKLALLDKKEQP